MSGLTCHTSQRKHQGRDTRMRKPRGPHGVSHQTLDQTAGSTEPKRGAACIGERHQLRKRKPSQGWKGSPAQNHRRAKKTRDKIHGAGCQHKRGETKRPGSQWEGWARQGDVETSSIHAQVQRMNRRRDADGHKPSYRIKTSEYRQVSTRCGIKDSKLTMRKGRGGSTTQNVEGKTKMLTCS